MLYGLARRARGAPLGAEAAAESARAAWPGAGGWDPEHTWMACKG